jgi:hypothetical protein
MNKKLKELLYKKNKVLNSLAGVQLQIDGVRESTRFRCAKCGYKNSLDPYGIYRIRWRDIVAEYQFICHKCKCVNRILSKSPNGYRDFMVALADDYLKFYKMIDVYHDENEPAKKYKWVNNFSVEELINEEQEFLKNA